MSLLPSTIKAVDAALAKIQKQLTRSTAGTNAFLRYVDKMSALAQRRKQLSTYTEEMTQRIDVVNVEVDDKIETLEGERKERIANIIHEYEEKTAKLPVIEDVDLIVEEVEQEKSSPVVCPTVQTVKKYVKKYLDDHPPDKNNFFHAAACSYYRKYVNTIWEPQIDDRVNTLLSEASMPPTLQYPLSLSDVDSIIHSMEDKRELFVILDTSLRVILTNLPKTFNWICRYFLIYDGESKMFAPISEMNKNEEIICFKCLRYNNYSHDCERHCPICLRKGEPSCCSKPSPKSNPIICSTCNAFCQTTECYDAHRKLCPLPVQGTHDDVLQLIESLDL